MSQPFRFPAAIMLCLAALACPAAARADEVARHAELVCQKGLNVALVRFTTAWNNDAPVYRRLPARVDAGLSATRVMRRTNCALSNGWAIRIRAGVEQAFAYGMGGADPPAFFSLWIAHRRVLSRKQWKPGYSAEDPWLVALVIRPDRLTYCTVPDKDAPKGPVTCRDERLVLTRHRLDPIEYAPPGSRPRVGSITIAPGSPEPSVCARVLRNRHGRFDDVSATISDSAGLFGKDSPHPLGIDVATVEIAPGVRRKLVRWGGVSHYFDGDLVFVAPLSANPDIVLKADMLEDSDAFPVKRLPAGWSVLQGGVAGLYPDVNWRYVHFDTQHIDGRLYLIAQPSNEKETPVAMLIRPLAKGFRTICQFRRVEEHF
jgi:hypothetical protein